MNTLSNISTAVMPELYVARDLARALAAMYGNEIDPSQIEHEDDKLARYVAHEEELERNYVGPKADRE